MSFLTTKRIFYINSRKRLSGTDSNFNYRIEFPKDLQFDQCCVLQCSIPKSYYVIQQGYNTFTLWEGLESAVITVPPGQYNRKSLQTKLKALLNAASIYSWTYNITYPNTQTEADTGKYTFTVTGNGVNQPEFHFTNCMFEELGFNAGDEVEFAGNSLTSTNVIKLQAEDTLYIHSDLVGQGNNNVLQEVFVNSDPSYASINFMTPSVAGYSKELALNGASNVFNFYLTDEDDNLIELNGQNMQIVLLLYKENDFFKMAKAFMKYINSIIPKLNIFSTSIN